MFNSGLSLYLFVAFSIPSILSIALLIYAEACV